MMCTLLGMMAFFWQEEGVKIDCFVMNYLLLGMMWFVIMMWTLLLGMPHMVSLKLTSVCTRNSNVCILNLCILKVVNTVGKNKGVCM